MDQPSNAATAATADTITATLKKALLAQRAGIVAYLRSRASQRMNIPRYDLLSEIIDAVEAGADMRTPR